MTAKVPGVKALVPWFGRITHAVRDDSEWRALCGISPVGGWKENGKEATLDNIKCSTCRAELRRLVGERRVG